MQLEIIILSEVSQKEKTNTIWYHLYMKSKIWHKRTYGFPGGASGKEPTCQCRGHKRPGFDPWVGKIPWKRAWQPTPVFLPGIPWTEERGGLQSTGSLIVGHDWGANTFTLMYQAVACQLQACCSILFVMQDLEFCQPHLSLTSRFPTGLHQQGP